MSDSSADRDPLDRLAEEFVARFRQGQRPALTEFIQRLPDRADDIRDLFPALVEMEQLKPASAELTGDFAPAAESSDPLQVGEFRILRQVGRGGMGVVYEAVQESLGRHVALKLLPLDALADPKRLERFKREAKAAAKLHHTNIVPVFGTGEADGRHFYAMQFIDGHPLDAVIDEVRRLKDRSAPTQPGAVSEVASALMAGSFAGPEEMLSPLALPGSSPSLSGSLSDGGRAYWETVARLGAQAADALAYAHAQGVQHRDIKPANLLLDLQGTVWVTDFGLAKASDADDLTHSGDIVGTLRYLAPERFDGPGDHRADVYALGLTLYELLTLRPAFAADSRARLVEQVTAANPPRPRSVNPAVPRDLETIVLKALTREPAARYQTAAELADDLRRYMQDRPIRARRASRAEQAWRWSRRNPAVASLIAAVLAVTTAGAAVASFFAMRADAERQLAKNHEAEAVEATTAAVRKEAEAVAARDDLRRLLYVSQINQLQAAWEANDIERGRAILRDPLLAIRSAELHGFEWHYWMRKYEGGEYREVPEPGSPLRTVFSPDGGLLAGVYSDLDSRSSDRRIDLNVFEAQSSRVVWQTSFSTPQPPIRSPEFSDPRPAFLGRHLAYPLAVPDDQKRAVLIWDWKTGEKRSLASSVGAVHHLEFDDAGRRLVGYRISGRGERTNGALAVWDVASGKELMSLPKLTDARRDFHFSPDGSRVAATFGQTGGNENHLVRVWDAGSGKELYSLPRGTNAISCLAVTPDGKRLAADSTASDGSIAVWDTASRKELFSVPRRSQPVSIAAFSPDGTRLALGENDGLISVWEVNPAAGSGGPLMTQTLKGHHHKLYDLTFSGDGRSLFSVPTRGLSRVWSLSNEQPSVLRLIGNASFDFPLAISPTGANIGMATQREGTISFSIRTADGKESWCHRTPEQKLMNAMAAFSPDGKRFAAGIVPLPSGKEELRGQMTLFDVTTGKELFAMRKGAVITRPAFSGDGRHFAFGTMTGDPRDLDNPTAKLTELGCGLVVASAETGAEVLSLALPDLFPKSLALSGDGMTLFAVVSNTVLSNLSQRWLVWEVVSWDMATGKLLHRRTLEDFVSTNQNGLGFSPDGGQVVVVRTHNAIQKHQGGVWDTSTGKKRFTIGGIGTVRPRVAFSPDGRRVVVTGTSIRAESTLTMYDTDTGRELLTLTGHRGPIAAVTFSADGQRLFSASTLPANGGTEIKFWDATPLAESK